MFSNFLVLRSPLGRRISWRETARQQEPLCYLQRKCGRRVKVAFRFGTDPTPVSITRGEAEPGQPEDLWTTDRRLRFGRHLYRGRRLCSTAQDRYPDTHRG